MGAATAGLGIVSVLLWFWPPCGLLGHNHSYRSLRIGLSDCSQRESQEGGSALYC